MSYENHELSSENAWYPDSGATNHVTFDLNNLNLGSEYQGSERIQMGNGAGLKISHLGSSTLTDPSHTSHSFLLHNLLHVPHIKKNLISVSQFAKDNHVYFEFHPFHCLVKDHLTHKVLLEGVLDQGLYKFTLAPIQSPAPLTHTSQPTSPAVYSIQVPRNTSLSV